MAKVNCWEYLKCGREPGGVTVDELGLCPAAIDNRTDGIHRGKYGGRVCWIVADTFCGRKMRGTFSMKLAECLKCDFYQLVRKEEGDNFVFAASLLERLK